MNGIHSPVRHNLRFYVVMTTVIIGGIFLFLFMNNNTEGDFSLTSALISDSSEQAEGSDAEVGDNVVETEEFVIGDDGEMVTVKTKTYYLDDLGSSEEEEEEKSEDEITKRVKKGTRRIAFSLNFDQIPHVTKEAKVQDIELRFADLDTKINVNNDKLELNNLQEVSLRIKDFEGKINFNELGISIDGKAKRLEVNNIALSSYGEIDLSFNDLDYEFLNINDLELDEIELTNGNGKIEIIEKMEYTLAGEEVSIFSYKGGLTIDRESDDELEISGIAKGISVNGDLMSLGLN
jgi:hypothetical protein